MSKISDELKLVSGLEATKGANDEQILKAQNELAIKFSTDHGGGGGGNLPADWGKKDDEDDWAWRRRSFGMALHLMKPSKKRNLKR